MTAASTQDRDGAQPLLAAVRAKFSRITLTWAMPATPAGWCAGLSRC
ncbi:hypothetical protein ACQP2U_00965 [Nocardia sp. CA-084685]